MTATVASWILSGVILISAIIFLLFTFFGRHIKSSKVIKVVLASIQFSASVMNLVLNLMAGIVTGYSKPCTISLIIVWGIYIILGLIDLKISQKKKAT